MLRPKEGVMNMVESKPSASDVVLLPGRLVVQAVKGVASTAVEVAQVPGRLLSLLSGAEKALMDLDQMTTGVVEMKGDMLAMRESLVDVISVLEGVNSGVNGMSGSVDNINGTMMSMDSKIESLQETLANVDLLAAKLNRFGGNRRARAMARELAKEQPEGA